MNNIAQAYIKSAVRQFTTYKNLGEKAMAQLADNQFHVALNAESNSMAVIVKHLRGNMLSRWTDFLTTDGEKETRNRDSEFEDSDLGREVVLQWWNEGWNCLFDALQMVTPENLESTIYIRNEPHTVMEAINRQIAHYSYHVGQMVFLAKALKQGPWDSLSIPRNGSQAFNGKHFKK